MKFLKTTLILALVLILLTGIGAISAQDFNETLSVSEDTTDNVELTTPQENSDILANESGGPANGSDVTNNESDDTDTLIIETGPAHSESYNIIVDTKMDSNKIKLSEDGSFILKIRNNNLFEVRDISFKYGGNDLYELGTFRAYSGLLIDDEYITISKLAPLQTKTFELRISPYSQPGKATLLVQLNPKVVPYDGKSRIITVVKTPTSVKKSKKFKATITHKVNKKPVKKVKVKFKIYTGKKYKYVFKKTNSKGVITFSVKSLKKGKHKIIISSLNKNYYISKTIKVKIK